jgi:hypothetical protein
VQIIASNAAEVIRTGEYPEDCGYTTIDCFVWEHSRSAWRFDFQYESKCNFVEVLHLVTKTDQPLSKRIYKHGNTKYTHYSLPNSIVYNLFLRN